MSDETRSFNGMTTAPLDGSSGHHRAQRAGNPVFLVAASQRATAPKIQPKLHCLVDGRWSEQHRHLGPQTRAQERRTVPTY